MHNIKDLRKNLDNFKKKLRDRNFELKTDIFENLDKTNRKLIGQKEKLEEEKGVLSKSKEKSNFEKSKKISLEISKISKDQIVVQKKLNELLHILPNLAKNGIEIELLPTQNLVVSERFHEREEYFCPFPKEKHWV